jgi:serine/threonine-protein kinase HipA
MPGGELVAGADLAMDDEVTRRRGGGAFRYRPEYLGHPEAYPFDPIRLPLSTVEVETVGPPGVPAVIAEALPDRWGRRLLARRHRLSEEDVPALILVARPPAVGALSFWRDEEEGGEPPDLEDLLDTARRIELGLPIEAASLARLLRHGSSVGGARPKALFRDRDGEYLAKFESTSDPPTFSIPRLEAASLSLAAASGLEACRFRLQAAAGKDVLLVHRFDLLPNRGRRHVLSLRALGSGLQGRVHSYPEAASLVRRIASDVTADLARLFRQMVFNVAIGNTDDHEGNFSLLYDGRRWSLSPAYDLLPDTVERVEHAMDFVTLPAAPDRRQVISLCRYFDLGPERASEIVDQVAGTVDARWREECATHGVEVDERWHWVREITRRVRRLLA